MVRAAACQCSTGSKAIEERKKKPSATYLIGPLSLFDIQGQKQKDWDTQTFQTTTQKEKKKKKKTSRNDVSRTRDFSLPDNPADTYGGL